MPAPIVIRNLTPETKKAGNPEPGQPLIATKAELRDGSRAIGPTAPTFTLSATSSSITATITESNGADSYEIRVDSGDAVSGLTVSGLTAEQTHSVQVRGYTGADAGAWSAPVSKATAAVDAPDPDPAPPPEFVIGEPVTSQEWTTRLTREGNGTPDPKFDPLTDIQYVGAFRIPYFSSGNGDVKSTRGMGAMAFKPADGTNGPNGSLFLAKGPYMAEVEIPALRSDTTDHWELNTTTVLQGFTSVFDKAPTGNVNDNEVPGWVLYDNGKLYLSTHKYYDGDGQNDHHLLILDTPSDLANSGGQGFLDAYEQDRGAGFCLTIPLEHQTTFGHTHFCGVSPGLSIVTRSSFGHSLIGFTPGDIGPSDTIVNSTEFVHFPQEHKHYMYDGWNGTISQYYAAIVNPPGTYNLLNYYSESSDEYQNHGDDPGSMGEFTCVPLGEPGRVTTLENLPLPDESIRKHVITQLTGTGCAFIPEGTDTVVFIGRNRGSRYGSDYKHYTVEDGPTGKMSGGPSVNSKYDDDPYIWMMNLNDIPGLSAVYDMDYYKSMPYTPPGPFVRFKQSPIAGHYERSTGRLYLLIGGFDWSPYNRQHVVAVYQITGGV